MTTRAGRVVQSVLESLTTRGRSFLAAGVAAGGCALLLDQRDLLRVGVLLVVLPLACVLALRRARYRLALTRTISPERIVAATPARVRLEIENLARTPTRLLLAEDRLPPVLGVAPRFVLGRLSAGRPAAVSYGLLPPSRGRYVIGPLELRLADPFGLCEMTRSFTATDPLIVVPRTWPLVPLRAGGHQMGASESFARNAAASGEDDVATREYRHGDDLRRVHWRSTAHRGELMVRRDEQPRQMRATVLLDTRVDGHRGEGAASSFEWAVSAAASVAVSLAAQRYGVRILLDEHRGAWTSPYGADGAGQVLDHLAVVEAGGPQRLAGAVAALTRSGGDGLVVAVLGEVDDATAGALARLGHRGVRGVALLLRTVEWARLPQGRAGELDAERGRAAAMLRACGWQVAEASPAETPAQVWARAIGVPAALGAAVGRRAEPPSTGRAAGSTAAGMTAGGGRRER